MIQRLEAYRPADSPIHSLDPRLKFACTLVFILSVVLLPDGAWGAFLLAWLVVLVVALAARTGLGALLKRSLIALPFALAAVTVLFTMPGEVVGSLGSWTISDAGLLRFSGILLRSWLAVQTAAILTTTTRFPDLVHAMRHLRVPSVLAAVISFMYRFLFVLADEAVRLLQARSARSARLETGTGGGSLAWRARVAGGMVGQLFLRSYDRSERVYSAMLARGYQGELLTMNPHYMTARDWLLGAGFLTFSLALHLFAR